MIKLPKQDELLRFGPALVRAFKLRNTNDLPAFRAELATIGLSPDLPEALAIFFRSNATLHERITMMAMLAHLTEKARSMPAERWLRAARETIDAAFRNYAQLPQNEKISCHAGCSHCCHITVAITEPEAEILADAVLSGRAKIDFDRLEAQQVFTDDDATNYCKIPKKERACPFLTEAGHCGAYEFRPLACRNHVSVDPPSRCDTTEIQGVRFAFSAHAALIVAATMQVYPSALLQHQVRAALVRQNPYIDRNPTEEDLSCF